MKKLFLAAGLLLAGCTTVPDSSEYDSSAAVAVQAPVSAAATTEAVDPAIWLVRDADTSIYVLGTFHLLPEEYDWRTPQVDAAIASSQSLVLETVVDPEQPSELAALMREIGFTPGLPPLLDRVAVTYRPRLTQMIAGSGAPVAAFDLMESWTAALTLFNLQARDLGLGAEAGTEAYLYAAFRNAGKPVEQLETNAEQLAYFDGLSQGAQAAFLQSMIVSREEAKEDFAAMLEAWTRGNLEGIDASFNGDMPRAGELYQTLVARRNGAWVGWVERRLQQPGTVMLAVGAGHLAGPDSLIELLKVRGASVTRLN